MNFKRLISLAFLLIAVLAIGSATASSDINDTIAVDDCQDYSLDLSDEAIPAEDGPNDDSAITNLTDSGDGGMDSGSEGDDDVCSISFFPRGGEGEMDVVCVARGSNYTLPESNFTMDYYIFHGWNVDDEVKQPGENITVISNKEITALWKYDGPEILDLITYLANLSIESKITFHDLSTGDSFERNVTAGPVAFDYLNGTIINATIDDVLRQAIYQYLNLNQSQTNVTIKNQNVSDAAVDYMDYSGVVNMQVLDDLNSYHSEYVGTCLVSLLCNATMDVEFESGLVNITGAQVVLSKNAFTYNAKVQKPTVISIGGEKVKEGADYTAAFSTAYPKNAGKYTITITGNGTYVGVTKATYRIDKASNPLSVKAKTAKVKFSSLKKKAQKLSVSKVISFTKKGQGTLTYAKTAGNKKIAINKKTGQVTVSKGLAKGTYKVKVKIRAGGNSNYKPSSYKTVTFKIQIK